MNNPETAIIIRARNEERWIGRVIERLLEQTYKDFEIVVVDSGSTDNTLDIVSKYPVKLVQIKPEEFNYPYAINIGIKNSYATKYIAVLSAHSLPVDDKWLESGVKNIESDEKVMGVYGPLKAMPDATFWDKVIVNPLYLKEKILCFGKGYRKVLDGGMGVMGNTNAVIKKDLWEEYPFNEEFGLGGEDGDWAAHWFNRGYYAIKDLGFTVHHSHYLDFNQWIKQRRYWKKIAKPHKFKYLEYRKDGAHKK